MDDSYSPFITGYATRLIRFKARQLCRRPGFSISDREDIEHHLLLTLIQRLPKYDPDKAQLNTFIATIIDRGIASLLRYSKAAKRCPTREECSLNDVVLDEDDRVVQRCETIPEPNRDAIHDQDCHLDVMHFLEGLPIIQREICQLRGEHSKCAIARELGISRRDVNRHLDAIFRAAEDAGLEVYL